GKTVSHGEFFPMPKRASKSALKRRLFDQCPIHIEKRRAIHAASRTIPALGGTVEVARARYFQPSTSTGNPRTMQNAAVVHVSTCARVRIVVCKSLAGVPSSAAGGRVRASSKPR